MKVKTIIVLIAIVIVLCSCAGPKAKSETEKLRREVLKWESFDSQGIVEVSYMGLAMRKMFSAAKNKQQIRFDIFDGGIMGAGAQPLISLYLGDYAALKSPYLPLLEMLSLNDRIPRKSLNLFANADSLLVNFGQEIIKTKKLEYEGVSISFLNDYRLDKVIDPKTNTALQATYGSNGKLQELAIKGMDNLSIKLIFDKIEYLQPQIVALPKPQTVSGLSGLLQGIEGLDFKSLLKEFLKNK